VVINQIDIIDPEHIEILQTLVWEKLNQHVIALSAKTGQNLQELIETIRASLPFECQEALEKEINKVG
jgi:Fe2+ transport system protein B